MNNMFKIGTFIKNKRCENFGDIELAEVLFSSKTNNYVCLRLYKRYGSALHKDEIKTVEMDEDKFEVCDKSEYNNDLICDFIELRNTIIYAESENKIVAAVYVDFDDIGLFHDLIKNLGIDFENGLTGITMFDDHFCVPFNQVIRGVGHKVSYYKSYFNEDGDWDRFGEAFTDLEINGGR